MYDFSLFAPRFTCCHGGGGGDTFANSLKISEWIHPQTGLWVYCTRKNMFLEKVKLRYRANKERVKMYERSDWKDFIEAPKNSSKKHWKARKGSTIRCVIEKRQI